MRIAKTYRKRTSGRKGWLLVGSHDHGEAAGHLFSFVASARCTGSIPRALRDLFRVLARWPRDRYLALEKEIGPLTVPEPLPTPARQQLAAADRPAEVGVRGMSAAMAEPLERDFGHCARTRKRRSPRPAGFPCEVEAF